jgi:hypothetical protein
MIWSQNMYEWSRCRGKRGRCELFCPPINSLWSSPRWCVRRRTTEWATEHSFYVTLLICFGLTWWHMRTVLYTLASWHDARWYAEAKWKHGGLHCFWSSLRVLRSISINWNLFSHIMVKIQKEHAFPLFFFLHGWLCIFFFFFVVVVGLGCSSSISLNGCVFLCNQI